MLRKTMLLFFLGVFLLTNPLPALAEINPQFDDAAPFSEGLAAVKVNDKWGFIDTAGNWAIKPQYTVENGFDELNKVGELAFVENFVPVKKEGKWGFINRAGEIAVAPNYDDVRPFSEGLAAVASNKKWGYVDASGQLVIPLQFDAGGPFKEGLALITIDKGTVTGWSPLIGLTKKALRSYVYADRTGKTVLAGPFDDVIPNEWQHAVFSGGIPRRSAAITAAKISSFSGGLAATRTKPGGLSYIDKQGQTVLAFGKDKDIKAIYPFHNDVAYLKNDNGLIVVIDKSGKRLTEPQYIFIGEYTGEGLTAAAEKEGLYGYISKYFRYAIMPRFAEAGEFFEGLAPVKENGKWGYIDKAGRYVNALQFEAASDFRAGVAFVKVRGKYALINPQFETIQVAAP